MWHVLWLTALLFQQPELFNPKAVMPEEGTLKNQVLVLDSQGLVCSVQFVPRTELDLYFQKRGVEKDFLQRSEITAGLEGSVAFRIVLENQTDETVVFNSDQIQLVFKERPVGMLVDPVQFWPISLHQQDAERETFAAMFFRGTATLNPREAKEQLVVFEPVRRKFPKKLELRLDRIYQGITAKNFHATFEVRYSK